MKDVHEEEYCVSYFQEQSFKQIAKELAEWICEHLHRAVGFEKSVAEETGKETDPKERRAMKPN